MVELLQFSEMVNGHNHYICRMLESGLPAYETIAQMLAVKASSGNTTRILVASLRNTERLC